MAHYQNAARIEICWRTLGLAKIYCQIGGDQNSRRLRFLLYGRTKGVAGTRGREEFAHGELWYLCRRDIRARPWAANSKYCPDVPGNFWDLG